MSAEDSLPVRTAPRLGALIIVLAIVALIAALPRRYHLVPNWLIYLELAIMIVPMILVSISQRNFFLRRIERVAELTAIGGALVFNSANLFVAAYNLVENPGNSSRSRSSIPPSESGPEIS